MSMHPSLSSSGQKGAKQRSVMKRIERIKHMIDKEQWKEGDKVFGLPKIKAIKIKIKKEKVEKVAEGAAATAGATGTVAAAPATGKPAGKEATETKK